MNEINYFDIHGLVKIKVIQPRKATRLSQALRALDHFKVNHISTSPDIIVEIGEFAPDLNECFLVDNRYYIKSNYLFCEDQFRSANWKIQIDGFEEGQTRICLNIKYRNIKEILIADYFYHAFILKQFITLHLRRKGYFLVSGGAVSNGAEAIVILGRSGAYKTTLLMKLLDNNPEWQFLGDDLIILGHGRVYSFPVFPWIFQYRKKYMRDENFSFFSRQKAMFYFLMGRDKLKINICDQCKIKIILDCYKSYQEGVTMQKISLGEITQRLFYGAQLEDGTDWNMGVTDAFIRYIEAYNYIFPSNQPRYSRDDFTPENILDLELSNIYQLVLPIQNSNREVLESIDLVKRIFSE